MHSLKLMKNQAAISKSPVRGTMNEEEIRLNREILLEISMAKKRKLMNSQESADMQMQIQQHYVTNQ